jgi:hypothetical protein
MQLSEQIFSYFQHQKKIYFENLFSKFIFVHFWNMRACVLWDTALFVVVLVVGDVSTGS